VNAFAVALLNDSLTGNTFDEVLTPAEQEAIDEAIRIGLEAAEAGRVKPIEQVIAEAQAKFRPASHHK
jgi:predicted transcriptional regulator